MISLYLGSLCFGGLLIGVSLLFGGGDHDADADADADVDGLDLDHDVDGVDLDHDVDGLDLDHDVDLDADAPGLDLDHDVDHDVGSGALAHAAAHAPAASEAIWLPFLSLRFWTFGSAAFGAIGLILSFLITSAALTAGFAVVGGLGIGTGAAWAFRSLSQSPVSGEVGLRRYVGQEARVVLAVRPGATGKIAVQTLAGRIELPARTRDGHTLERGQTVLIAHIDDGVADVTGLGARKAIQERQST